MSRAGKPNPTPEDTEAIARHAEQTREALGETVSALAAKADVKGRVSESVSDAKQRVADTVSEAKHRVSEGVSDAAHRVSDGVAEARTKAADFGDDVAAELSGTAQEAADMLGELAERVRRNPLPYLAAAAGALVLIILMSKGRRR